nr:mitogen-activated protein kinase kinase kinase 15-like [Pelodiscus sinensis]|eukprot:XP_025039783.1 mitogen-activated protein kinase kinase kinase 15-like [Pelodiscus sinensis]
MSSASFLYSSQLGFRSGCSRDSGRKRFLMALDTDVAVVDMSDVSRQPSLFYHLGVRESFDMANNVILYHDTDADTAQSLKDMVSQKNTVSIKS